MKKKKKANFLLQKKLENDFTGVYSAILPKDILTGHMAVDVHAVCLGDWICNLTVMGWFSLTTNLHRHLRKRDREMDRRGKMRMWTERKGVMSRGNRQTDGGGEW